MGRKKLEKAPVYAYYKGDTFVAVGTAEELANCMGVKKETIQFQSTPTYKKRVANSKNAIEVIRLEDDED